MRFEHEATPVRIDERVAFAPVDLLASIVTASPPASVVLTLWLSMIAAEGLASRPTRSQPPRAARSHDIEDAVDDLAHRPSARPARSVGLWQVLKAQVEQLQAQVIKLETEKSSIEAVAVGHRADFERERERSDKLMTNNIVLRPEALIATVLWTMTAWATRARRTPLFWPQFLSNPIPARAPSLVFYVF